MNKVSVLMITYNHAPFIAEALDSVLMQEVNFEYDIVIGEDFSTDSTRSILLEYKNRYPDKISLILHGHNVGMHKNYEAVLTACKGEYIAVLEGDDYWTSKCKLQKQVDLMDCNPAFSECFHKVKTIYQESNKEPHEFPAGLRKTAFNLYDVLRNNFIPTPSMLFRKTAVPQLPDAFHRMTNPDWMLHVMCAENGEIGFINEVMGVYRVHSGGVWSATKRVIVLENTIKSAYVINQYLGYRHDRLLRRRIARWHCEAGILYLIDLAIYSALKHLAQCIGLSVGLIFSKHEKLAPSSEEASR